jgi:hypothetical protein
MPSKSKKQHDFMAAVAHSPKFAKKAGVPMSVGSEFMDADKGKTFRTGGASTKAGINKQKTHHGSMQMPNVSLNKYMKMKDGGMAKEDMKMDMAQDKAMIKKAFGMHEKQMHEGKKTDLTKLAKGGSASARADGCAVKGKTKGTMVAMCGGGMYKKGK